MKRKGFTLAEVLITLGIIGVVAAMTIPALMNHSKAVKLRAKFNKAHAVVAQLVERMDADDMPMEGLERHTVTSVAAGYINGVVVCADSDLSGYGGTNHASGGTTCHEYFKTTEGYKYLDRSGTMNDGVYNDGELQLMDGTLVMFNECGLVESEDYSVQYNGCIIATDINGKNPPNQLGYDFFLWEVVDGVLYPAGERHTTWAGQDTCVAGGTGTTCAQNAVKDNKYFENVVKHKF